MTYDPQTAQRERLRKLEQRCNGLQRERDQLTRILAMTLADWYRDGGNPHAYLEAWVSIDQSCLELGI